MLRAGTVKSAIESGRFVLFNYKFAKAIGELSEEFGMADDMSSMESSITKDRKVNVDANKSVLKTIGNLLEYIEETVKPAAKVQVQVAKDVKGEHARKAKTQQSRKKA